MSASEITTFLSSDGTSNISVKWWLPERPKAIVQIEHGMAEYAMRYDWFATQLMAEKIAVCADDHIGHGDSVKTQDDWGFMGEKDGYKRMADDAHQLTKIARERFPGIPLVLFGHSMGSFLVRYYAQNWSEDIDALIVCGTAGPNPAAGAGNGMASVIKLFRGSRRRSNLLNAMAFGSYNKRIEKAKTPYDWLSVDEENVKKYVADPACGFTFTVCGFKDLFSLLSAISKKGAEKTIRKDLPILFIAGAEDPVGSYGEGVKQVYKTYIAAGIKDCSMKLYDGARHEILNDFCKDEVFGDIMDWYRKKY